MNRFSVFATAMLLGVTTASHAEVLFRDDFNGSAVDENLWRLPVGVGTFFGRTQIKPPTYQARNLRPVVSGGTLRLQLDTYNASALVPGDSFWGHEVQSRHRFSVGSGLSLKARIRYLGTPPGGLVGGFFFYGLYGTTRDEVDFELLSNDLGEEKIFTNIYRDARFGLPGNVAHIDVPGLVLDAWNEYEIQWFPNEVQWLVNGKLVRQIAQGIPQRDMEARINIWGPDASFPQGYNAALQPVDSPDKNREFQLQVDHVVVTRLAPDLAVESPLTVDRDILTGQPFKITAKVVNAGDAPSSEARLRLFSSQNPSVSPVDVPIGTREISGLPPSGTFAADTSVTAPLMAGSYWVIACIDAVTGERTSTNNCSPAQEINVEGPNLPAILSVINFIILDEDETE